MVFTIYKKLRIIVLLAFFNKHVRILRILSISCIQNVYICIPGVISNSINKPEKNLYRAFLYDFLSLNSTFDMFYFTLMILELAFTFDKVLVIFRQRRYLSGEYIDRFSLN